MITLLIAIWIVIDQKKFEKELFEEGLGHRPACTLQHRLFALAATGIPVFEIWLICIIIKHCLLK